MNAAKVLDELKRRFPNDVEAQPPEAALSAETEAVREAD